MALRKLYVQQFTELLWDFSVFAVTDDGVHLLFLSYNVLLKHKEHLTM